MEYQTLCDRECYTHWSPNLGLLQSLAPSTVGLQTPLLQWKGHDLQPVLVLIVTNSDPAQLEMVMGVKVLILRSKTIILCEFIYICTCRHLLSVYTFTDLTLTTLEMVVEGTPRSLVTSERGTRTTKLYMSSVHKNIDTYLFRLQSTYCPAHQQSSARHELFCWRTTVCRVWRDIQATCFLRALSTCVKMFIALRGLRPKNI